ncbi:GGDEF domain-containing protein [Marinomonas sp. 2405UD68-3]|uniref:GGDEF domain-containing protein n=1 Tax=Marinomonas sp. 2405UD68-3 TaxID=3391835 RepID=UPI0039C9A8A3
MPKKLNVLLMPLILITACMYVGAYIHLIPSIWLNIFIYLPFVFAGVLILLAWHFNKGRLLVIAILLCIPLYQSFFNENGLSSLSYITVTVVNLSVVAFMRERGFFNRFAVNRIAFIGMQLAWCLAFEKEWVSFPILNERILANETPIWSTLILWGGIVACLILSKLYWWRTESDIGAGVLITQVALVILFYVVNSENQISLLLSGCFLVWILYILIESHRMAYVDDLTQLNSRRALNEKLLALPKRYVVAMVDVDHFKRFNDTYGHDMGDLVLYRVANELSKVSGGGKPFRYGGEEFTIIFFNKRWSDVEDSLENLRESIENMRVSVIDPKKGIAKNVQVTVSLGVSESRVNMTPEEVIKLSDEALYQAKRKGRNRIELNKKQT